jgi:monoamine oxidase
MVGSVDAQTAKPQLKILVLGAGMSGIMVATALGEKGFTDITILEATSYIGGRLMAGTVGSRYIELGANWTHGVGGNTIYDLTVSKKLVLLGTNWTAVAMLTSVADPDEDEKVEV